MSTEPTTPSQWAQWALSHVRGQPACTNEEFLEIVESAINQACAQKDTEIARLKAQMQANQDDADKGRAFATEAVNVQNKRIAELEAHLKDLSGASLRWREKDERIAELEGKLGNCQCCSCEPSKCQRIAALEALLDRVPHHTGLGVWIENRKPNQLPCIYADCPACAWAAMKEGR